MGGKRKGFTPEQIIGKLRGAEVLMSNEAAAADACRKIGVADVTFYRWRKLYGGMQVSEVKRPEETGPVWLPDDYRDATESSARNCRTGRSLRHTQRQRS